MNTPAKSSVRIKAVTFDAGGTLIEVWPSVGQVYADVAAEFGVKDVTPETLDRNFAAAWKAKGNFDYSRGAWREVVRRTFGERAGALPADFFPALYGRFAQPGAWRVYEDVLPTLETLAGRGFRLGVISNWDERLRPLLARLGIGSHLGVLLISKETGQPKPAPAMFERAAAVLRLPPQALLHVGDSPQEDVAGARAAGLRALLLDRKAKPGAAGVIGTLTELVSWLERGGNANA